VETVLDDQQAFFRELRERVGKLVRAKKAPQEVQAAVEQMAAELTANARIARYVNKGSLKAQTEKVYHELTGQRFPAAQKTARAARAWHAHSHGLPQAV
jgi:hypothetical protein